MRTKAIHLLVLGISAILIATENSPGQIAYESSVQAKAVEHRYMDSIDSIQKLDFTNLQYFIGDCTSGELFQLRNGKAETRFNFGFDKFSLEHVYYFRPGRTEHEAALVEIRHFYGGGSSSQDGLLLVFQIDDGGLVVTQQLVYDQQAKGTGTGFDSVTRILTVRARSNDDSAHCCPKSIDVVILKWNGKAFEEKSHRTLPVEGQ